MELETIHKIAKAITESREAVQEPLSIDVQRAIHNENLS